MAAGPGSRALTSPSTQVSMATLLTRRRRSPEARGPVRSWMSTPPPLRSTQASRTAALQVPLAPTCRQRPFGHHPTPKGMRAPDIVLASLLGVWLGLESGSPGCRDLSSAVVGAAGEGVLGGTSLALARKRRGRRRLGAWLWVEGVPGAEDGGRWGRGLVRRAFWAGPHWLPRAGADDDALSAPGALISTLDTIGVV
jgi:hypothetical protein